MLRDFSRERFDLILLAGQSNADGRGFGDIDSIRISRNALYQLGDRYFTQYQVLKTTS